MTANWFRSNWTNPITGPIPPLYLEAHLSGSGAVSFADITIAGDLTSMLSGSGTVASANLSMVGNLNVLMMGSGTVSHADLFLLLPVFTLTWRMDSFGVVKKRGAEFSTVRVPKTCYSLSMSVDDYFAGVTSLDEYVSIKKHGENFTSVTVNEETERVVIRNVEDEPEIGWGEKE